MTEQEQFLIKQAASLRHTTPTSFIRDQAVAAAEDVLYEQKKFILTNRQWTVLEAAFATPPRILPKLKQKLAQSDTWDDQ